jgi:hypothetical protein
MYIGTAGRRRRERAKRQSGPSLRLCSLRR